MNKKLKRAYFRQSFPKTIEELWSYCKPYFTSKGIYNDEKIVFVEKEQILLKDSENLFSMGK